MIPVSISLLRSPGLAEIPVLDWKGPEFLAFYGVALAAAYIWSRVRVASTRARFEVPGPPKELSDPYEIAFLSEGPQRVGELAVLRLSKLGLVEFTSTGTLKATSQNIATGELDSTERCLLAAVQTSGEKGWPVRSMGAVMSGACARIETRLAAKGLRPAAADLKAAGSGALWPVRGVMILGIVKLLIGMSRDRPVGFLVIALVVTLVLLISLTKKLKQPGPTPAGRAALDRLVGNHTATSFTSGGQANTGWMLGAALFGTAALAGAAEFDEINRWMIQQRAASAGGTGGGDGSGGSSCSTSSCSSSSDSGGSSCGSSGCGGCGGGGD